MARLGDARDLRVAAGDRLILPRDAAIAMVPGALGRWRGAATGVLGNDSSMGVVRKLRGECDLHSPDMEVERVIVKCDDSGCLNRGADGNCTKKRISLIKGDCQMWVDEHWKLERTIINKFCQRYGKDELGWPKCDLKLLDRAVNAAWAKLDKKQKI